MTGTSSRHGDLELRPLTQADVEEHNAGEDELTVRWLNGQASTRESTTAHLERLARNAAEGRGAQGFGVWLHGRLAGYVEYNPDVTDGLEPGDANISYAVHPWARGQGVAAAAVAAICHVLRERGQSTRAAIRVSPDNRASVRVAEKAGFTYVRDLVSETDREPDGAPATLSLYLLDL